MGSAIRKNLIEEKAVLEYNNLKAFPWYRFLRKNYRDNVMAATGFVTIKVLVGMSKNL